MARKRIDAAYQLAKQMDSFGDGLRVISENITPATVSPASRALGPRFQPEKPGNIARNVIEISITRATTTIAADLPVPVFAPSEAHDGFNSYVAKYQGSGVSITVPNTHVYSETTASALSQNYTLTYSDGVNTDIVTIAANGISYKKLQQLLLTDQIVPGNFRLSVTSDADADQFAKPIYIVSDSGFGSGDSNVIIPNNYVNEFQQLANFVTVGMNGMVPIDLPALTRSKGLIFSIKQKAAFTLNITFFVTARFLQS